MPPLVGSVRDHVPAAAAVCSVTTPLVAPDSPSVPAVVPATPRTGEAEAEKVFAVSDDRTVPAEDVAGYVAVVAVQLVPSARRMAPAADAVDGNAAAVHVGSAEAPPDDKSCPADPVAVALMPFAALPTRTPYCVRVARPVPPFPTGSVPVTPAVRLTCAHEETPDPLVVRT